MTGNKKNIILIIQILQLVYPQPAPAMAHLAPVYLVYVKINVDYHLFMIRNKNKQQKLS